MPDGETPVVDVEREPIPDASASDGTQATSEEGKQPSEPRTLTEREHQRVLGNAIGKKDQFISQLTKENESQKKARAALEQRIADLEHRWEEQEDKTLADDPEALNNRREQRAKEKQGKQASVELETERQTTGALAKLMDTYGLKSLEELEDKLKESTQSSLGKIISEAASEVEGDENKLAEAVSDLGLTSKEAIAKLAKRLFPAKPLIEGEPADLRSKGGVGALTAERIEKMSIDDLKKHPDMLEHYK